MAAGYTPERYRRHSIRLRAHDYGRGSAIFITICTYNREPFLAEIVDNQIRLNALGRAAEQCWTGIPDHFSAASIDQFVVMPNHLHGILLIRPAPGDGNGERSHQRNLLGGIIGSFKSAASKRINAVRDTPGSPVWQRNYYDHVIRDDQELDRIQHYIMRNPLAWHDDEFYAGSGPASGL